MTTYKLTKPFPPSPMRKHPWEKIDPLLLSREVSMVQISNTFRIPYRQVTNRRYWLQWKLKNNAKAS